MSGPPLTAPVVPPTTPHCPPPTTSALLALNPQTEARPDPAPEPAAPEVPSAPQVVAQVAQLVYVPNGSNQLKINVGDKLEVVEKHESGWAYGRNLTAGGDGWFPAYVSDAEIAKAALAQEAQAQAQAQAAAAAAAQAAAAAKAAQAAQAAAAAAKAKAEEEERLKQERLKEREALPKGPELPHLDEADAKAADARAVVRAQYVATDTSQLTLNVNDAVEVVDRHESGWTYGKLIGGTTEGWFPDWVLTVQDKVNGGEGLAGPSTPRAGPASTLNVNAPVFSPTQPARAPEKIHHQFTPPARQMGRQALPGAFPLEQRHQVPLHHPDLGFNPNAPAFVPRDGPEKEEAASVPRCRFCGSSCGANFIKVFYSANLYAPLCSAPCWQTWVKEKAGI